MARADPLTPSLDSSVAAKLGLGPGAAPPSRRLVIPLSNSSEGAAFHPSSSHNQLNLLLVNSTSADSSGGSGDAAAASTSGLAEPLLSSDASYSHLAPTVDALSVRSSIGSVGGDMWALSIELQPFSTQASRHPCYLIELAPSRAGDPIQRCLALPAPIADLEPSVPLLLPPAIDRVTLSTTAEAAALTIHKRVPTVGWFLLIGALFTCYSGGPVTDLQREALPAEGSSAFLHSAWRGTCSALCAAFASCLYPTSRRDLYASLTLRLDSTTSKRLLFAGLAFFVYFGAFNLALEKTSISHAALFSSCSSIYIVLGRLLGSAAGVASGVPPLHLVGVVLGAVGAYMATRDAASSEVAADDGMAGDLIALCSGLGAAFYLSLAEVVRLDLDPLAFFTMTLIQFAPLCLFASYFLDDAPPMLLSNAFDAESGALGWLNPIPARLLTQLWLGVIVDLFGNFGFIAVMAYVPSLTVAAVMLLGPLTSCLEGIAVGVDQMPGPWTLGGGLLITAGSGLISFATSERTATVEIGRV